MFHGANIRNVFYIYSTVKCWNSIREDEKNLYKHSQIGHDHIFPNLKMFTVNKHFSSHLTLPSMVGTAPVTNL